MKVLVIGGAGYIGSHMCLALQEAGWEFAILDNLSTGHAESVSDLELFEGTTLSETTVNKVIKDYKPDTVMYFAAKLLVGESVVNPALYYRENIQGILNTLDAMRRAEINNIVFSSTAAVYGNPEYTPIDESHPCNPINPYGRSKLYIERILEDYCSAYGMNAISLRYFNAAGAHHCGGIGESHHPETHLIPNILNAALSGESVTLFGDDYPTEDGFCVRDYIHIEDICQAHILAAGHFQQMANGEYFSCNLGTESGASVMQVLKVCEAAAGQKINYEIAKRRPGDAAVLVASSQKATELLNWHPKHSSLPNIITTALEWHKNPKF